MDIYWISVFTSRLDTWIDHFWGLFIALALRAAAINRPQKWSIQVSKLDVKTETNKCLIDSPLTKTPGIIGGDQSGYPILNERPINDQVFDARMNTKPIIQVR